MVFKSSISKHIRLLQPHQAIEHPASLSGVSVTGFPAIACAKAFAK
jgi:hypothetical protein